MASGYEKHDCGVDPGGCWGNPRPVESLLIGTVAVALSGLIWGRTTWWVAVELIRLLGH